jgi:hypothetical protein
MLIDGVSADPVKFMLADSRERCRLLIEAMPLKVTPEQILERCGVTVEPSDCEGHALEALGRLRARLYDERTGINGSARGKRSHAEEIMRNLPADDAAKVGSDLVAAHERETEISATLAQLEAKVRREVETKKQNLINQAASDMAAIDEQIALLREKRAARQAQRDRDIADCVNEANAFFTREATPLREERQGLLEKVARLEQVTAELERAAGLRAAADKALIEAEVLSQHSAKLTEQINSLDALAAELAGKLPIPGVEIRTDGNCPSVFVDGIPFERLNRAKQVQVALRVARLRAGELPLVVMDNAECLDEETFAAFEAAAEQSGLQILVTRVTHGPMEVK